MASRDSAAPAAPATSDCRIVEPPNTLKAKVNLPEGGILAPELVAAAEAALGELQEEFAARAGAGVRDLKETLPRLHGAAAAADGDGLKRLYRFVFDVAGQGGSVGYPLASVVGRELCRFIDGLSGLGPRELEVIDLHLDAISVILHDRITGDGGARGAELLAGLRGVIARREQCR